jgi:hydrogenase expression/formation protein HypD
MTDHAHAWLDRIRRLALPGPVRIMNVCGGHERSITSAGLRTLLPPGIELIPGPGCPVCVCPEEDIHQAIRMALQEDIILLAFGDMLRVPANVPKGEPRSLEQARAAGADVRPVATPGEVVSIARNNPDTAVVFFAAGFETTMAPVAGMLAQGTPDNLYILLSGRRTWPAVAMLLDSGTPGFDAMIAPGHVATVMGPEEWEFVAQRHYLPAAIAGFTAHSLLAAIHSVLSQHLDGRAQLDNCYPELVRPGGNRSAQQQLTSVFDITVADWRGIGSLPASGYAPAGRYQARDARRQFPAYNDRARRRAGLMPPGCDCAQVVLGRIRPAACRLYGSACTPRNPVGPCMVSDEGACRIWWSGGVRKQASG